MTSLYEPVENLYAQIAILFQRMHFWNPVQNVNNYGEQDKTIRTQEY